MRATQPPRRCKCDECQETYVTLQEMDLFAPAKTSVKGAMAVAN